MESVPSANINSGAENLNSDATEESGNTEVASTESKSSKSSENDPNESFEAWSARQAGAKAPEPKKNESKEPKVEAKPAESKEPPKEEPKKPVEELFKIKVNGVEKEVSKDELIKRAQLADASNEKFQKAAQIQKQLEQFEKLAETDPMRIVKSLKLTKEQLEEFYYNTHIKPEIMTPEEKMKEELELLRGEKKTREDSEKTQREAEEKRRKDEELEVHKERQRSTYAEGIQKALSDSGLPINEYSITQMATYLKSAVLKGYKHISPSDVVDLVKQDMIKAQQAVLKGMSPAKLAEFLGDESIKSLREHDVASLKNEKFKDLNEDRQGKVRDTESKEKKKRYSNIYDMLDD